MQMAKGWREMVENIFLDCTEVREFDKSPTFLDDGDCVCGWPRLVAGWLDCKRNKVLADGICAKDSQRSLDAKCLNISQCQGT